MTSDELSRRVWSVAYLAGITGRPWSTTAGILKRIGAGPSDVVAERWFPSGLARGYRVEVAIALLLYDKLVDPTGYQVRPRDALRSARRYLADRIGPSSYLIKRGRTWVDSNLPPEPGEVGLSLTKFVEEVRATTEEKL